MYVLIGTTFYFDCDMYSFCTCILFKFFFILQDFLRFFSTFICTAFFVSPPHLQANCEIVEQTGHSYSSSHYVVVTMLHDVTASADNPVELLCNYNLIDLTKKPKRKRRRKNDPKPPVLRRQPARIALVQEGDEA